MLWTMNPVFPTRTKAKTRIMAWLGRMKIFLLARKAKLPSQQRGVAILAAIVLLSLIVWMATEVAFETAIEYGVRAKSIQNLQAYYNARAGIELGRLRLAIYQRVQQQFGNQLQGMQGLLNLIWQAPFFWPPIVPEGLSAVDKDEILSIAKESSVQGSFMIQIYDEGSKIDLNDLASPSRSIQAVTRRLLTHILEERRLTDRDFAAQMEGKTTEQILALITDWIDRDVQAQAGGSEPTSAFNRWFKTPEEIFLVEDVPMAVLEHLSRYVTLYGQKAINPNTASKELLMALDRTMISEVVDEIIQRRSNPRLGGPFQNTEDFWSYANSRGARVPTDKQAEIPLVFDQVQSFRIESTGEYRGTTKKIVAIVWNYPSVIQQLAQSLSQELTSQELAPTGNNSQNPTKAQGGAQNPSPGLLPIVYWQEL